MKLQLKNVRLAFPNLFTPTQVNGEGKPAYSGTFLIDPQDPQVDAINDAIDKIATEKWGVKTKAVLAAIRGKDAVCLHNGDLKAQYDGFEGMFFVSARNPVKPLVIDRNRDVLVEGSGRPYGGCFVNANVELWAQDNKWGKRVNATLRGVQFVKDGDAFAAGAPATEDEFDDIGDTGEEDDIA